MAGTATTARVSALDRAGFVLGRTAGAISRATGQGAGGTLPGRVVLALRPHALRSLSMHRQVILVSGTNGKSTTTRLLASALAALGPVVSNADGANLSTGLVAALMSDAGGTATAALEVDELALPAALAQTRAMVVVLLNLSRDQLDRVEEVASHVDRWATALQAAPQARIVANADDPLVVAAVHRGRPDDRAVTWVGAGSPWRADACLCPECGAAWSLIREPWGCDDCGLRPPAYAWELGPDRDLIDAAGTRLPLHLSLPGRASAANAAMAAAAAAVLGVPAEQSVERFRTVRDVDGRYQRIALDGREVQLLLAKNPAGWLEVLSQLAATSSGLLLGINAKAADGVDPSWIWDVPFEQLRGRQVVVFGERALDLSVRLEYAEVPHTVRTDVLGALASMPGMPVQLAANYTAFVAARSVLRSVAA